MCSALNLNTTSSTYFMKYNVRQRQMMLALSLYRRFWLCIPWRGFCPVHEMRASVSLQSNRSIMRLSSQSYLGIPGGNTPYYEDTNSAAADSTEVCAYTITELQLILGWGLVSRDKEVGLSSYGLCRASTIPSGIFCSGFLVWSRIILEFPSGCVTFLLQVDNYYFHM